MKRFLWLVVVLLFAGCGDGGGGGEGGVAIKNMTPVGTAVDLSEMKNFLEGSATPGTKITYHTTGSDLSGNSYRGTSTITVGSQTSINGEQMKTSRIYNSMTETATGIFTSGTVTWFVKEDGTVHQKDYGYGVVATPVIQTRLPASAKVGDSGDLSTVTLNNGYTIITTWRIDPGNDAGANLVLTETWTGNGAIEYSVEEKHYVESSGRMTALTRKVTYGSKTVTLTGPRV